MFGSQVLETAIGLAVMFFILATAASAVTESLSRLMRKRSKDLEKTIVEMLTERASDESEKKRRSRVAEVKSRRSNAQRFMNLLQGTSIWQAAEAAAGRSLVRRKKIGNSYLSAKSFAEAINEILLVTDSQEVRDALPESLRTRLTVLYKDSKRGMLDVRAGLESWFDETMSRAEGAYKRWAALVLFVVGLAFAVLGNASTTDVARDLWQDPATRAAIVDASADLNESQTSLDTNEDGIVSVAELSDKFGELSLPVGWDVGGADDVEDDEGNVDTHANNGLRDFLTNATASAMVLTMVGWVLTGLLVMLGGPFWFDALTRLVALRGSGRKPPTAADDSSSATSRAVASATPTAAAAGPSGLAVSQVLTAEAKEASRKELEPLREALGLEEPVATSPGSAKRTLCRWGRRRGHL